MGEQNLRPPLLIGYPLGYGTGAFAGWHSMIDHLKLNRTTLAALAAAIACVLLLAPATASAQLYKYETSDGDIVITTEKKSGLKLIEVISSGSGSSNSSRSSTSSSSSGQTKRQKRLAEARQRASEAKEKHMEGNSSSSTGRGEDAFDDIIAEAAEAYDVPFGFIKAVIRIESAFQPRVVSHAGAQGLMQLMPRTADSLNVTDPFDPRQNIFGGTKFLRLLIDRYDGDINLILAAYNAGDAAVARYEGIPYAKTRDYVASVYYWYKVYQTQQESP